MNYFVFLFTMLLSASTFACPQIAGHYTCKDESNRRSIVIDISQSQVGDVQKIILAVDSGEPLTLTVTGRKEKVGKADITTWCNDEAKTVSIHSLIRDDGRIFNTQTELKQLDSNSLKYSWYADVADIDGSNYNNDIWDSANYVCTKN